jgi:tetratricopeptide (TPR) repeat protein
MSMPPRNVLRIIFILALIVLAIVLPLILSGYSELRKASVSSSYAEAARHYQNAAQRMPWRGDLYELSGHMYYYAKDYVQADVAYQKAYARHAFSPQGWVAWGDVNYLNNNPERAREIWEQALQEKNPSDDVYSRLAEVYQVKGDTSKAAEYLEKYVSTHPQDAIAHYRLGLLLTLSDPNRALSVLNDAAQLDPQLDSAVETLRTTLDLALQSDDSSARLVVVGRGLGLVNEWKLARVAFESAVETDEKNAEAWAWLGEANQQTGVPAGGSAELEQALRLNPDSPTVRGLRGLYFQRTGNFRQALAEFQSAAALEPENPTWLVSVGEAYSKNGDLIQALELYKKATTLAPDEPSYWRLLAIFCAQNNINVKDVGLPAAQKAVFLTKADATSLDVLGWLLLLDASYDGAERMLKRALELDAQNASVHLHLGMLYMQTDNRASAYDHLIQARDLGNSDAEAILKQYFP